LKQSFLRGTLILFLSGLINRVLGFAPRILLPRMIGAEGVGLFQMSYPFLILLLTIITGGLPIAVAKMIAAAEANGDRAQSHAILRRSLLAVTVLSAACGLFCLTFAPWLSSALLRDERVYMSLLVMTPMLFIVGTSSVFRGYFQGKHNMLPTAVSQVVETVVRTFAVVLFAGLCLPYGLAYAAAGAMAGVVVGETFSLLYLLLVWWRERRTEKTQHDRSDKPLGGTLLRLATPITLSKMVASTSYFFESVLIMQSLAAAGIGTQQSTALYGVLQGMIIPILVLPNALTYSLSLSLVPNLADAHARGDWPLIRARIQQSLKLCIVSGAPFAILMFLFAEPICRIVYHDADIAWMLRWMAPCALFLYLQGPLQAALQALDGSAAALRNTTIAALIKLTLIYLLASSPQIGIVGAVIAINVNIVITAILHARSVRKRTGGQLLRGLQLPALAFSCTLMFTLCALAQRFAGQGMGAMELVVYLTAGTVCYLSCLHMFGIVRLPAKLKSAVRAARRP
jgi:stage V sporulation protein B